MLVCLGANALFYPAGGHVWAYLNWALSLREIGCEVMWLESAREHEGGGLESAREHGAGGLESAREHEGDGLELLIERLRATLQPFGLAEALVIDDPGAEHSGTRPLDGARDADLFLDLAYLGGEVRAAFRRTALLDIDPGFTQLWWSQGDLNIDGYDTYFTIGRNIPGNDSQVLRCGVDWHYVPPCVHLPSWPLQDPVTADAPWTTVTHWQGEWQQLGEEDIDCSKRSALLPLLNLPESTVAQLELAAGGLDEEEEEEDQEDLALLRSHGWRTRSADLVAGDPLAYRSYIQGSRGEFSVAKALYVRVRAGWLSDRTVCYLATGRPAIVQDTGIASAFENAGLGFFDGSGEAAELLNAFEHDYDRHRLAARRLAEEWFDGTRLAAGVLERALAR
ncbi:MAG TPA: hypothetical protein VFP55_11835 [Solirubrobacteraceae bacterium]|nr:hypothetical protein [Solirubrobacteraceae bacterium]